MSGPCLCGDPACSSCGSPGDPQLEAAVDWATEQLYKSGLTTVEIKAIVPIAIETGKAIRAVAQEKAKEQFEAYLMDDARYN